MSRSQDRLDDLPVIELPGGLRVHVADSRAARRHGLAGLDELPADAGLWIDPCPSIHTFGMRFDLDLVWLDKRENVVTVVEQVPQRSLRSQLRKARSVIEVNAGQGRKFAAAWADRG